MYQYMNYTLHINSHIGLKTILINKNLSVCVCTHQMWFVSEFKVMLTKKKKKKPAHDGGFMTQWSKKLRLKIKIFLVCGVSVIKTKCLLFKEGKMCLKVLRFLVNSPPFADL